MDLILIQRLWPRIFIFCAMALPFCASSQVSPFAFWQNRGSPSGGTDVTPDLLDWADFDYTSQTLAITGIDTTINLELSASFVTGTPTIEYSRNAGAWTAFSPGAPASVAIVVNDTLAFRVTGTEADQATVTVRNSSDGDVVLDTVTGTYVDLSSMKILVAAGSGSPGNRDIALPLGNSGDTVNVTIDWGDPTANASCTTTVTTPGLVTCRMPSAGNYTVTISGSLSHYGVSGLPTFPERIIEMIQWGDLGLVSVASAFRGAINLNSVAPPPATVTDMTRMFNECTNFNQDIGSWDVSNVTDMSYMFDGAAAFNADITGWDVSNVVDMRFMFARTTAFNQPVGSWTTSSLQRTWATFWQATGFNQPLAGWNMSSVTDMYRMFEGATAFDQPLGNWDVSSVTNAFNMGNVFYNATNFNQDLSCWNVLTIATEPLRFGEGSSMIPANYPVWGTDGSACL